MQEESLGDYKIIKQVGQGTLGLTLLAEHRFIKKQYILKVLPQELCEDRAFLHRFEEEVLKLNNLDHPHIVKVHNVSYANGKYFLVTDCIVDSFGEITNLAQYMSTRKDRLKEDELMSVMQQIADVLDYAHTKGQVIHRSLKLSNILIGQRKPGIEVFVSDFGLAQIISPGKIVARTFKKVAEALGVLTEEEEGERYSPLPIEGEKLSKLTQAFIQSFAFLAPEQKHCELVGVQADTYAFGVIAYYLTTGTYPEGFFAMPSSLTADYKFDWDHLVTQCLQSDPNRRPTQLMPLLDLICHKRSQPMKVERKVQIESHKIEAPPLRQMIEEGKKELSKPVEELKEQLELKVPQESVATVAQPQLKPVIKRSSVPPPPSQQPKTLTKAVVVEGKDISEATPPPMTPPKDEDYSKALNTMLNRDPVVKEYQPEQSDESDIEPLQTEMIVVQGGEFWRGSNVGNRDEAPLHRVYVDSFAIDIHPVTNEHFVRFLKYMGGEKDQNYNDLIRLKDSRIKRSDGKFSIESGYIKHPVVGVTWYGAVAYAKRAGKRLPSEAEWEIAARGGLENYLYPFGDTIEKSQANFFSSDTTPVMSYVPNPYGLYDIIGNVYEWCQDWYGYTYYEESEQEPTNPKGPLQGVYRVLRGGCWKSLIDDMRCSHRHRNNPGTVNSTYGFRCAADVQ